MIGTIAGLPAVSETLGIVQVWTAGGPAQGGEGRVVTVAPAETSLKVNGPL